MNVYLTGEKEKGRANERQGRQPSSGGEVRIDIGEERHSSDSDGDQLLEQERDRHQVSLMNQRAQEEYYERHDRDNNFNGWGQYQGTPQLEGAYGLPLPKKLIPALDSAGKDLNDDLNDTASPDKYFNEEGEGNTMSDGEERNMRWELDVSNG